MTLSRRLAFVLLVAAVVAPVATAQYGAAPGHPPKVAPHAFPQVGISVGSYGVSLTAYRAPRRVWVAGGWTVVERRVWVPGGAERRWVPAVTRTVWDACGVARQVVARPGHWTVVRTPGRWETRAERLWQPGHWTSVHGGAGYGHAQSKYGR